MVTLPGEPLLFFSPREYAIFHAVSEAILELPAGQPTIADARVVLKADKLMAGYPEDSKRDFHRLLGLFDNALAGLLFTGNAAPFSQLGIPERQAVLTSWENSRIGTLRSGFVALKRLAVSCYYCDPATYRGVGYPGPPDRDP